MQKFFESREQLFEQLVVVGEVEIEDIFHRGQAGEKTLKLLHVVSEDTPIFQVLFCFVLVLVLRFFLFFLCFFS